MLEDFAAMAGLEVVVIDADTKVRQFKQELHVERLRLRLEKRLGV